MSTQAAPPASLASQPATAVLGYGLGDFANSLVFSLGTTFLLFYYTDVAGLAPAAIAVMFLVVRLWDALADLLAGRLVDRTRTRWGRFRPFLLWFGAPVLFLSLLSFNVPAVGVPWLGLIHWDVSADGFKLLYAYLTYAVLGLAYSLVNVPYGSLAPAMTRSVRERAKLVSARAIGATLGGLLLTVLIAPPGGRRPDAGAPPAEPGRRPRPAGLRRGGRCHLGQAGRRLVRGRGRGVPAAAPGGVHHHHLGVRRARHAVLRAHLPVVP